MPMPPRLSAAPAAAIACAILIATLFPETMISPAAAQTELNSADGGKMTVELNKFEEIDTESSTGGCRAFFLFRNATGKSFDGFEMSLAILDGDGVIDRLLAIDAAPQAELFRMAAEEAGIPLTIVTDDDRRLAETYAARLILVRPDQYVCWTGNDVEPDAIGVLKRVSGNA